jgi:putative ABC transport system permease protein
VSLTFPLPLSYAQRLKAVDGVTTISWANWFGGVYQTERNFFPQFAVEPASYLKLYPEYVLSDDEKQAFLRDRQGAIVGRKLANTYGWKVGDPIPIRGTIYSGAWFAARHQDSARPRQTRGDLSLPLVSTRRCARSTAAGDFVGVRRASTSPTTPLISQRVDPRPRLTAGRWVVQAAFQLSFVSMSEAILAAIEAVSYIIIVIIMAVMANTMTMTARERMAEYATLKALGFSPGFVVRLLFGESLLIALIGGGLGLALTFPAVAAIAGALGSFLPVFKVQPATVAMQIGAAAIVGAVAAAWPAWRMSRIDIVQGLRHIG